MKVKISGCINACGHTTWAHRNLGVDRKGDKTPTLGERDGPIAKSSVPFPGDPVAAVDTLMRTYIDIRETGKETWTVSSRQDRAVRERLYAAD